MDDFSQLISKEAKKKISFIKKYINKFTHSKRLKKIKRNLKTKIKHPKEKKFETKDKKINNQIEISNNQKINKKRNAGIDLLRIVTMIGIIYSHVIQQGKGLDKYNRYRDKINYVYTYFFFTIMPLL